MQLIAYLCSQQLYVSSDQTSAIAVLGMPSITYTKYGAPQSIYLNVTVSRNVRMCMCVFAYCGSYISMVQGSNVFVDLTLQWFNKTSTRLPESISFAFVPTMVLCGNVYLDAWRDSSNCAFRPTLRTG
jgi:hypothetical protein